MGCRMGAGRVLPGGCLQQTAALEELDEVFIKTKDNDKIELYEKNNFIYAYFA
jgi:hypothetical protein